MDKPLINFPPIRITPNYFGPPTITVDCLSLTSLVDDSSAKLYIKTKDEYEIIKEVIEEYMSSFENSSPTKTVIKYVYGDDNYSYASPENINTVISMFTKEISVRLSKK